MIPELAYPDVGDASVWLCDVFGFSIRLRIANHRVQLEVGDGAIVVTEAPSKNEGGEREGFSQAPGLAEAWHSVMVRIEYVAAHHARAKERGAQDLAGHVWTFTPSIADVDPESWRGVTIA